MKKVLFAALCFACLGFGALQAQKTNSGTTTGSTDGSTARNAKGVGKGTPLIQRNAATGSATDDQTESKSEEASPTAPAPASKAVIAPATERTQLRDSLAPAKTNVVAKPKEAATSK